MILAGLQKLTLLDYPGEVACTVFTKGCNLRCPFCHNPELVLPGLSQGNRQEDSILKNNISSNDTSHPMGELPPGSSPNQTEAFFDYLNRRRGKLSGVVVSGGEPTLHADLPEFLGRIREMGFLVKLDTNGMRPEVLRKIVDAGLVDYVAMDVKNSPRKYAMTCGIAYLSAEAKDTEAAILWERARESISILMEGHAAYEFRTTVVTGLHTEQDIKEIARQLSGARAWYLQQFIGEKKLVGSYCRGRRTLKLCTPSVAELEKMKSAVQLDVPSVALRGV